MTAHPLARGVFVLLGLASSALGLGLFLEGDPDESEEILFAAALLVIGVLNLAAAAFVGRPPRLPAVAVAADALLLGFVLHVFSQGSVG